MEVCHERDWPIAFEWREVELCRDLLKPIAEMTTYLEGQYYSTCSLVIPALLPIREHLQDTDHVYQRFGNLTRLLLREIDRRFSRIFLPADPNFNPTLLICTMLNPAKSEELSIALYNEGKRELKRFLRASLTDNEDEIQPEPVAPADAQPVAALMGRRRRVAAPGNVERPPLNLLEAQIVDYLHALEGGPFEEDPIEFWHRNSIRFPKLWSLALEMLAIPATSAPVERLFSASGLSASGRRTNIGPQLVEAETLIKYNKRLFLFLNMQ